MIEINTTNLDLIKAIKHAIKNKKPLSVSRCGDGEMHILKNEMDFSLHNHKLTHHHSLCSIQFREKIWVCDTHKPINNNKQTCDCYLNSDESKKWLNTSRDIISYSIKHSDFIGLTVPKKLPQYYSINKKVLSRYGIDTNSLKTISSLFPLDKNFSSIESFKKIIQGQGIHIVTPNVKRFKQNKLDKMLGVTVTYTDISDNIAYKLRHEVFESIKNTREQIILFGGGYAIKDLIPKSSKELGKISIDVGSILDAWSGYQSRNMFLNDELKHLNWF